MRMLTDGERAQIGAELVAELYRNKLLLEPVNKAGDGNRVITQGQLFRDAVSYVDGVEDYLDTATAGVLVAGMSALIETAHKLEIGNQDWDAVYRWACERVETATTEEEAR